MNSNTFTLSPIGYIRITEHGFCLEILPVYRPALNGLEGFSHLHVLWWGHLCDDAPARQVIESPQPYRHSPATLGIFATRSPLRPNPVSMTVVAILKIEPEKGLIHLPYIDGEDGTPIIDLKPYHPSIDRVRDVQVPDWCRHWPQWYEESANFDWAAEFVNAR